MQEGYRRDAGGMQGGAGGIQERCRRDIRGVQEGCRGCRRDTEGMQVWHRGLQRDTGEMQRDIGGMQV